MHEPCNCIEWQRSEPQLEEMVLIAEEDGFFYTGKKFDFCPWCGSKLTLLAPDAAKSAAETE